MCEWGCVYICSLLHLIFVSIKNILNGTETVKAFFSWYFNLKLCKRQKTPRSHVILNHEKMGFFFVMKVHSCCKHQRKPWQLRCPQAQRHSLQPPKAGDKEHPDVGTKPTQHSCPLWSLTLKPPQTHICSPQVLFSKEKTWALRSHGTDLLVSHCPCQPALSLAWGVPGSILIAALALHNLRSWIDPARKESCKLVVMGWKSTHRIMSSALVWSHWHSALQ